MRSFVEESAPQQQYIESWSSDVEAGHCDGRVMGSEKSGTFLDQIVKHLRLAMVGFVEIVVQRTVI